VEVEGAVGEARAAVPCGWRRDVELLSVSVAPRTIISLSARERHGSWFLCINDAL